MSGQLVHAGLAAASNVQPLARRAFEVISGNVIIVESRCSLTIFHCIKAGVVA